MSGAKSRRKGAKGEREFCRMVRDEMGVEFGRNLKQYAHAQEGDTDPLGRFLPEVKNCARINERDWWRQAVAQAKKRGLVPLLAYKVARHGWRIVVPLHQAWTTENAWRESLDYTMTLRPAGLWLLLREAA
jgi:hypothetical protein